MSTAATVKFILAADAAQLKSGTAEAKKVITDLKKDVASVSAAKISPADAASAKSASAQYKADLVTFREWRTAMKDGAKVADATRTNLELYAAEVARLRKLLQAGALDQETFTRAMAKAKAQAEASASAGTPAGGSGTARMPAMLGGLAGPLGRLKGMLGGEGIGSVLRGGLMVGILEGIGQAGSRTARAVDDMTTAVRLGDASFRDLAAEGARQIPVLGRFVQMFDSIRFAITGERAELEKLKRELQGLAAAQEFLDQALAGRRRVREAGAGGDPERLRILAEYKAGLAELGRQQIADTTGTGLRTRMLAERELARTRDEALANLNRQAETERITDQRRALDALVASLREEAEALRVSKRDIEFNRAIRAGATVEQLRQVNAIQASIEAMRAAKEQAEAAQRSREELARQTLAKERETQAEIKRLQESMQTPVERYAAELERIRALRRAGLDETTAGRAIARARDAALPAKRLTEARLAGAAGYGTVEEYSSRVRGSAQRDERKRLEALTERQAAKLDELVRLTREEVGLLRNGLAASDLN